MQKRGRQDRTSDNDPFQPRERTLRRLFKCQHADFLDGQLLAFTKYGPYCGYENFERHHRARLCSGEDFVGKPAYVNKVETFSIFKNNAPNQGS
ncbi:MAG: hypothetical protein CMM47_07490 [Rhodospirillaceae bacterium]|nr:hypothetical protein [Rhodospirillaceae bacterium]